MKMMKQVMAKAVELAKKMEGDWVARMKLALKMAWALVKKVIEKDLNTITNEVKEAFLEEMISVTANIWEKYGKRRIYVNAGYGLKIGYLDFDQDGNFVKAWSEYSEWDNGKSTAQFKVIKELMEGGNW